MPLVRFAAARGGRFAFALFVALVALGSARALARPPHGVPYDAPHPSTVEPVPRSVVLPTITIPPQLRDVLQRIGGSRAVRVAQGLPAGNIALRPMFWITRDHSGAMFALGGLF